jgi:hypothetical protein
MTDRESHRQRRGVKKCNRPFTAPRRVVQETVESEVQGPTFIPQTQMQESSEDRPVVRSLRNRQKATLSLQEITDCQDGPKGDKAIGVKIAKSFGGYEYRGTVDKVRIDKEEGYIYHVEYEDGDEEELSQIELRDGYILGLSPEIEAMWAEYKKTITKKSIDANLEEHLAVESDDQAMSDGEGSLYDKGSDEEELNKKKKKRRKERRNRGSKKLPKPLSGMVLPVAGEKTVAAEAFGKLNPEQQELVATNINKKTKKVVQIYIYNVFIFLTTNLLHCAAGRTRVSQANNLRRWAFCQCQSEAATPINV